jgi:hypothetical protein
VLTTAIGAAPLGYAHQLLAAWRGPPAETAELQSASVEASAGRADGTEVALARYALAVVCNGLGDHPAAGEAAARACETQEMTTSNLALPELVEAASRAGQPERATAALEQLSARTRVSGTRGPSGWKPAHAH